MLKVLKNRYNLLLVILYLILLVFGLFFIAYFKSQKVEAYESQENKKLALKIQAKEQTYIREKKETTLAMAVALAQNNFFKHSLKSRDSSLVDLKKISDEYNANTSYKNVWIQLVDADGRSFARSWTQKRGDNLYDIREDIRIVLKEKTLRSTISVGVFSISFKSMVPIMEDDKILGIVEIITHFNSIEKRLQEQGVESVVLVDKKFESRLTHSLTKSFIEGYYVANFDPNREIMELLESEGVEKIIAPNRLYFQKGDRIITASSIYNEEDEVIAYFIASSDSLVQEDILTNIEILHILYGLFWIAIVSLLLYLLLDKNLLAKKFSNYHYSRNLIFYFTLFFIFFITLLYLFLEAEKDAKIEQFLKSQTQKNENSFTQIYGEYEKLSRVVYETAINTPEIKAILSKSDRDRARVELYDRLLSIYKLLESYNLKQLHFHLPDNRSFLRFHRPEKYGDDLTQKRESVAYVNRNKEYIHGFEEGSIFNGLRFVFPLYDRENYLGSVEVSFSVLSVMDSFIQNYGYQTEFFMKKSIVDKKVTLDEQHNYIASPLSDFYYEKNTKDKTTYFHNNIELCKKDSKQLVELNKRALKGRAFSFTLCNKKEVVTFIPLFNPVTKEFAAVLGLSSEQKYIREKELNALIVLLTLSIFIGFMLLFMYRELVAKRKIRDINAQLNNAQKIAKIGHWELDVRNNHLYWSDETFAIFEIDKERENPTYEKVLELIHPEDREKFDAAYRDSLVDKKPYTIEHRLLFADGRVKYVEDNSISTFDTAGNLLSSGGTMQDITSRKLIEQSLEEERRRIEVIINASRIGLWEFDMQSDTIFWDKYAFEMLGYAEGEFALSFGVWLELMHPDDRQRVQKSLQEQIKEGDSFRLEYRFRHKDGSWFWIGGSGEVVEKNAAHEPIKMVGIHIDFNAQKAAESALMRETQKAQEANRAKSQFLANMSHEIRTPMNAVIGLGSLLEDMELGEKERDILYKMNSSSKMLLKILNDILDYSKIEAGKLELEHSIFKLEDAMSQLELMFRESALSKGIAFELSSDERLPCEVYGDELRLVQVLVNFVSNAIKFTADGSVEVRISLKRKIDAKRVELSFSVSDTGIGMSKEQTQKLFQAFVQADSSTTRKYGGSGLGLVISQNILKAMHSEIEVKSEIEKGTQVSFDLELEVASWSKEKRDKPKSKESTHSIRGAHLLVVEDNELNQDVVSMMLESLGVEVDIANNGAEGVEMYFAQSERYDAILMDLQMPIMGGYEASQKIREKDKKIPIIALTAAAMIEDRAKVLAAGMNDHIAKPIDKEQLYKSLLEQLPRLDEKEQIEEESKHEFAQKLQEMQEQLSSAAFMEQEYLESFYESAKPHIEESLLREFREAVEEFEFDRALEILKN